MRQALSRLTGAFASRNSVATSVAPLTKSRSRTNPLLCTDVYKMGHMEQYVPGCTKVYSYLQARSNRTFDKTVLFGAQYFAKEYLTQPITNDHVTEFLRIRKAILGTDASDDVKEKLARLANLGFWPLEIKAVPEGTVIPTKNVLLTMTNTDPDFFWTVGFIESMLLKIWYPITVATTSFQYKVIVNRYFEKTVDPGLFHLKPFMVHDFGYRGDSSEESSKLSGMAHLTSFTGSDTVPAFQAAVDYYNVKPEATDLMVSVPASEHSVMCSFGKDGELDAYRHMLKLYPTGICSIVSDTYDIYNVLTVFAKTLKDDILKRDGVTVFRPDSGNQEYVICGDPTKDQNSPEGKGCLRLLDEMFGSTRNSKGFKQLNPKVGLIYGDGLYLQKYEKILERMMEMGYASSNLVIGVGGILRYHSRDTLGFAIKATKVEVNGVPRSIMKDPVTDKGKKSHTGYLRLDRSVSGEYVTTDNVTQEEEKGGVLVPIFRDGKLLVDDSLTTIRERVASAL